MYSGPLCNFCDAAKRLLLRNNLKFTEIDISTKDELRDEIDSIGSDFSNIMHPHKKSPIIKEIIFDGVLRGMINKFIGNHFPIQSQLRFKPPLSDGFSYHQDDYWTQAGFGNTMNVLVHIDEATIDNGSIYVLPKSHKPPFHEDRVYITSKPGDVTFLHNYVT